MTNMATSVKSNPQFASSSSIAAVAQRAAPSRGTPKAAASVASGASNNTSQPDNATVQPESITPAGSAADPTLTAILHQLTVMNQRQTSMETAVAALQALQKAGDDTVSVSGASAVSDLTSHMGGSVVDPYSNI